MTTAGGGLAPLSFYETFFFSWSVDLFVCTAKILYGLFFSFAVIG